MAKQNIPETVIPGQLGPWDFSIAEVTDYTIIYAMMHIARCEEVFQIAKTHLDVGYFNQAGEYAYRAIWVAIFDCHKRYGKLAEYALLQKTAMTIITHMPGGPQSRYRGHAGSVVLDV